MSNAFEGISVNGYFGTGRGRETVLIGRQTVSDLNPATGTSRSSARVFLFSPVSPFLNVVGAIIAVLPKYR